ncbi:unnamed protein product [Sphagnum troendelagicum]
MPITWRSASLQVKNIPATSCFYNLSLLVGRCGNLRWAEHTCMKMTPSGIAETECLGHDPGMGASLDDICGLVALTNLLICGDHDSRVELPHKIFALTKLEVLELQLMNVETLPAKMPEVFEQFVVIELTEGSAIHFIAVQILDYKEQGKCQAGLEDNPPFAITITAAMICRLVLPVKVERDEREKGSSALGAANVRYAPMGVISFIPFIQLVGLDICLAWYKQTTVSNICHSILGTLLMACSLALLQCSCSTKELAKPPM